ncbi:MAG: dTDP-4-dehydrorhamnose 3,5-epimerase family protein [Planctomycetia bacterium]|nr:dTDP-4-dehydrorhamnose 3,5-epimerase family protein [Planctomycetia bacterium]
MIGFQDFKDDSPWQDDPGAFADVPLADQIDGVRVQRLTRYADGRGDLTVLMSAHYDQGVTSPHVYLVTAVPGSVRAWVFHRLQHDRLAFTAGRFRIVLYDLRPESGTYQRLNVLDAGEDNRVLLTIPPLVAHGVQNIGAHDAQFVNMPTRAYDPSAPDKARLSVSHPGVPYVFD